MRSNKFGAIKRIRVKAKEMDMKDFDIFDHMDGIPDKESEKVRAQEVYKKVRNEFKSKRTISSTLTNICRSHG